MPRQVFTHLMTHMTQFVSSCWDIYHVGCLTKVLGDYYSVVYAPVLCSMSGLFYIRRKGWRIPNARDSMGNRPGRRQTICTLIRYVPFRCSTKKLESMPTGDSYICGLHIFMHHLHQNFKILVEAIDVPFQALFWWNKCRSFFILEGIHSCTLFPPFPYVLGVYGKLQRKFAKGNLAAGRLQSAQIAQGRLAINFSSKEKPFRK